jgi:hypothetical protein
MSTVNNSLIKIPHKDDILNAHQITEFAKCVEDPKYFIKNYCYLQHPTKGKMKFSLYEYQERLIDVYHGYRNSISMLPRQSGKSQCAAAYLLWYAMFKPDSTILIAAHVFRGAQEIMGRIRFIYENIPNHIRAGVVAYNRGSIEFDNGSRIVAQATTENTGRGMALTLVYLDEFAFVGPNIASEFWTSLSPTLSTGGRCIITSTPNQDNDQFAQIWHQANKNIDEFGNERDVGINGFKHFIAHWNEHPDRDEKWAEEERGKIGDERFLREFELKFIAYDETLINSIFLSNMFEGFEPNHKTGQVRWYKPIQDDKTYIVSLDPSLGTGGDYSAIQVLILPDLEQVAEWQSNMTPIKGQITVLKQICEYIKSETKASEIYWSVENNSIGEACLVTIQELGEENIPGLFLSQPKKMDGIKKSKKYRKGFTTTHTSKLAACARLKNWIESDKLKINSKNLVRELKTFVSRGTTYKAKEGETDDLVMALILSVRMIEVIARYDEDMFEDIKNTFDDDDEYYNEPMPVGFL